MAGSREVIVQCIQQLDLKSQMLKNFSKRVRKLRQKSITSTFMDVELVPDSALVWALHSGVIPKLLKSRLPL